MERRFLGLLAALFAFALLAFPLWAQQEAESANENANEITIPEGTDLSSSCTPA